MVLAIGTELAETDYDVTFKGGFEIPGSLLRIDIDPDQTVRNYPADAVAGGRCRNWPPRRCSVPCRRCRNPCVKAHGARPGWPSCARHWRRVGTSRP
ncbi:hypothetical protein PPS11_20478 [Pseudomonas putida S11]|nr:hypothetical protein PPS11_20478 [Pseudomonas putida S11]